MNPLDLARLEKSLKNRWKTDYNWLGHKQNDVWDKQTNFIYNARSYGELTKLVSNLKEDMKHYALNRWYNFWSAMGVEQIFRSHKKVLPLHNQFDKQIDFFINNIPFDHKSTIFPKGFKHSLAYAKQNKEELMEWLYKNQSQEGRNT